MRIRSTGDIIRHVQIIPRAEFRVFGRAASSKSTVIVATAAAAP